MNLWTKKGQGWNKIRDMALWLFVAVFVIALIFVLRSVLVDNALSIGELLKRGTGFR